MTAAWAGRRGRGTVAAAATLTGVGGLLAPGAHGGDPAPPPTPLSRAAGLPPPPGGQPPPLPRPPGRVAAPGPGAPPRHPGQPAGGRAGRRRAAVGAGHAVR